MKVICINEKWTDDGSLEPEAPVFNEECLVTSCQYFDENIYDRGEILVCNPAGIWYRLRGYKHQYHASNFAILPDKSADEMSQESKEAIINIEQPLNA